MSGIGPVAEFYDPLKTIEGRLGLAMQTLMMIASGDDGWCQDYCANPCDAHNLAATTIEAINIEPKVPLQLQGWPTSSKTWPEANKYLNPHTIERGEE